MIITITPNPALDLSGFVDNLIPNEKSYVYQELRSPGGNAINAARVIHHLKVPVLASGFLGGGVGAEIEEMLREEGVQQQFIHIQGNTRISVTVSNRKTHLQTRLSFSGPTIKIEEKKKLIQFVSSIRAPSLLVVGGSLPPGISSDDIAKLVRKVRKLNVPVIVDMPGLLLKEVIRARPILIKPNLTEFQLLVGKKVVSKQSVIHEAQKLIESVPLICISSVEGGALLITPQGSWFGTIPRIKIKTTVGAGDSMVGAMAAYLWKQKALIQGEELLRWGLASATATLSLPGLALGSSQLIRSFLSKVKIIQIK